MSTNSSGYVLIASGCYSDYQTTAYRVLKPFSFEAAAQEYRAQFVSGKEAPYDIEPSPDGFVAWLNRAGYVEDASEIQEVHVGQYGELDLSGELLSTIFTPRPKDSP